MGKEHSITIPDHDPIKIGTLNKILIDIAEYLRLEKDQLINDLKDELIGTPYRWGNLRSASTDLLLPANL